MFSRLRKTAFVAVLICAIAPLTLAQGALLHKRVNYSFNVTYRLGDYVLPAGDYVLRQILANDQNLFGLYERETGREPIAIIRTARIDYSASRYPDDTKMLIRMAESDREPYPVLQGWAIPGDSGWEIISIVSKNDKVLTRIK